MSANKIKIDNALLKRYKSHERKSKPRRVVCKILIVCEGTKTEPNYFRKFAAFNRGSIVYEVNVKGMGANTMSVVDEAIRIKENSEKKNSEYDRVWAVFDKDSFDDSKFNGAIDKAKKHNVNCSWSNEAFELWFLYHFCNVTTATARTDFRKRITEAVNNSDEYKSKKAYVYEKNAEDNYEVMNKYGSQENAIKWAEAQSEKWSGQPYAKQNPCTMVYQLVRQLIGTDAVLNKELMDL